GGLDTVGVRIPRHKLALELIEKSGVPLAAPSANISGGLSPTEAIHVYEDLRGKIPLILDGGKTQVGIESTVLDLTKKVPVVLRPGWVTAEELSEVLGEVINHKGEVVIAESPGMKYRHYAPKCPVVATKDAKAALRRYDSLKEEGFNPVIIGSEAFVLGSEGRQVLSLGKTADEHMSILFSSLRGAEKEYDFIIIEYFPHGGRYTALNNRIIKSAGGNII
ncbi:MAG: L-threonylcarbamoyladenylate synthase, partial [Clostridia bacterium]